MAAADLFWIPVVQAQSPDLPEIAPGLRRDGGRQILTPRPQSSRAMSAFRQPSPAGSQAQRARHAALPGCHSHLSISGPWEHKASAWQQRVLQTSTWRATSGRPATPPTLAPCAQSKTCREAIALAHRWRALSALRNPRAESQNLAVDAPAGPPVLGNQPAHAVSLPVGLRGTSTSRSGSRRAADRGEPCSSSPS